MLFITFELGGDGDAIARFEWARSQSGDFDVMSTCKEIAMSIGALVLGGIRSVNPLARGVTMVVRVSWRFYDNMRTLPPEFRRRSRERSHLAGDLLATDVGKVADPARIGGTPGPVQSDVFRLQQK